MQNAEQKNLRRCECCDRGPEILDPELAGRRKVFTSLSDGKEL